MFSNAEVLLLCRGPKPIKFLMLRTGDSMGMLGMNEEVGEEGGGEAEDRRNEEELGEVDGSMVFFGGEEGRKE